MAARHALSAFSLVTLFGCAAPPPVDPCAPVVIKDGNMPSVVTGPTSIANAGSIGMTVRQKSSDPACKR